MKRLLAIIMTNRKWILWLLMAAMLLGTFALPAGAEDEGHLIFCIISADDDSAWVRTNKGLMHLSIDGEIIAGPMYPDAVHYAMDPNGHIYYSVDSTIIEVDKTGAEIERWETGINFLQSIHANEKYILATSYREYIVIDKDTGAIKSSATEGRLTDIAFYDDETFLLLQKGPHLLSCHKFSTLEEVAQNSLRLERYTGIALSKNDGTQYLYEGPDIVMLPDFESELQNYATLSTDATIHDIYMTDNTIWCIENFMVKTYLRSEIENKVERNPEKTLYIVGQISFQDSRLKRAKELFEEEYPEYAVQINLQTLPYMLKTNLMANSPGYDVLLFDSMTSADIKNSGFLADLSENEVILQNLESYIDMPFLWEEDGRLFGVPVMVHPYTMMIPQAKLDQIEGGIPKNWTWEDFAALADDAEEMGLCLVQANMFWQILLQQYTSVYCDFITGEADYSNDTFRQLVTMWKELSDNGSICYDGSRHALLEYRMAAVAFDPVGRQKQIVQLGMPSLNGKNTTPVYMQGFYANQYSENADAAIRFLEIYSSVEVQSEGGQAIFLPDLTMYPDYYLWKQFDLYTEEDFENWKLMLSNGMMLERSLDQDQRTKELVTDLLNDKITVDEFVSEMQETADLMIGE